MNDESNLLQILAKAVVFDNYKPHILKIMAPKKIVWQRLKDLLLYHELAPFLYMIIKKYPDLIPEDFSIFIKNEYYNSVFKYMLLWEELIKILDESKREGILILPIKGFSFSDRYYKRYGFRPLLDIDLLIKEEELDKGAYLLQKLEYNKVFSRGNEEYWRKKQSHLVFIKNPHDNPICIDLHWALDFKRGNKAPLFSPWKRIKMTNMGNKEIPTLSLEDTILSISLHQRRFGKILNLKYVCDIGLILQDDSSLLDWDYILKTAEEGNFKSSLYFLLAQTQIVLDINLEKYLQELTIPLWKIKFIFKFIKKYTYLSCKDFDLYYLYLLYHFFLFDNIMEPLKYIINIPQEQFARFYKLPLYGPCTESLYRLRFFYIFYRLIKDKIKKKLF